MKITVAAAIPALALAAPPMAHADGPAGERDFIKAVRGDIPTAAIPNGLHARDPEVIQYGYQACRALDKHPYDPDAAIQQFYGPYGYSPEELARNGNQTRFMVYSAEYLCSRNLYMYGDSE